MPTMRLLVLLNEKDYGAHDDVHQALLWLREEGQLESYYVYSFLAKKYEGRSDIAICQEIVDTAENFLPTALLWMHTGKLNVSQNTIKKIRNLQPTPIMGYWDGDVYIRSFNPMTKQMISLASQCDVFFAQGKGQMTEILHRSGCNDIRYCTPFTDENRFGYLRQNPSNVIYDVVMIGSNVYSKLPWRNRSGIKRRQKLVRLFSENLGHRFAVFGHGWKGSYAKGPIPFSDQTKVYHKSRLILAINNCHAEYYTSNRLPIALSSGVPVVHNYEEGLDIIYKGLKSPLFFRSLREAWNIVAYLLSKSQYQLDSIGRESQHFALSQLSIKRAFRYMVDVLKDHQIQKNNQEPLFIRENPWINEPQI